MGHAHSALGRSRARRRALVAAAIVAVAAAFQSALPANRSFSIQLETTPPARPTIDSPVEGSTTPAVVTLGGKTETGTSVKVREGGATIGIANANAAGNWSFTVSFPSGPHTVTAIATDPAGNPSPESDPRTFNVDADRPSITITTQDGTIFLPGDTVAIDGTADDNRGLVTVVVEYVNVLGTTVVTQNATLTPTGTGNAVTWVSAPARLLPGRYTVRATAIDLTGTPSSTAQRTFIKIS